jgi:PucR-like helix-turn-helix protein/diguanylate cyclase with GGDEF domain
MLKELQRIADSLAARLQRSVAIDDPQMRLLVHTPHLGETVDRYRIESIMQRVSPRENVDWAMRSGIAVATEPVRVPPNADTGVIARICVPVRCRGILLAYLWLLDADQSATEEDLDQAMESATAAGEVLFREQLRGDLERSRDRELLRDLLASDESVRSQAARQLVTADRLPDGVPVVTIAVRVLPPDRAGTDTAIDLALRRAAGRLAPLPAIWTTRGGTSGVLLAAGRRLPAADRLHDIAEDLHAHLTASIGTDARAYVGIGPAVPAIEHTQDSHRGAEDALLVAMQVPGFGPVAVWDDLGVYGLLIQLPLDQLRDRALPAGLLRLTESDESGVLLQTLETYLDEGCSAARVLDRLNVHRSSLYYRLRRTEEITGMDLASGGDRLSLHLGIKLGRLIGLI